MPAAFHGLFRTGHSKAVRHINRKRHADQQGKDWLRSAHRQIRLDAEWKSRVKSSRLSFDSMREQTFGVMNGFWFAQDHFAAACEALPMQSLFLQHALSTALVFTMTIIYFGNHFQLRLEILELLLQGQALLLIRICIFAFAGMQAIGRR